MASQKPPSRQREHQANERTFLAWLRTSISLIGFGFAISRFGLFLEQFQIGQAPLKDPFVNSQQLGIGLVTFGLAVILLAAWRYSQVFSQIERGNYSASRRTIWVLTALITLLGVLSLPLLLEQPQQPSPSPPPPRRSQPL
jgi:putative membrane protein